MSRRHEEMQAFYHHYKRINKKTEVTMAEVAAAPAKERWPIPPPISDIDRLAQQFADAVRFRRGSFDSFSLFGFSIPYVPF